MSCTLYSIDRACGALAGITALIITDMTNVANYGPGFLPPAPGSPPTFYDNDLVYSISMERYSGVFSTDSVSDQGGDYAVSQAAGFVPLSRAVVEVLLRRLRNRPVMVIAIDRLLNQHLIYEARASYRHSTGDAPGTRHGYRIQFTGPSHYLLPSIAGEGDIPTAPPVGGVVPSPGSECCITIEPTNIAFTPAPTGNATNLNQIVTTSNGSVYFIDGDGRGIILNRPAPRYYFWNGDGVDVDEISMPMSYPLPDPDDYALPTYSEQDEISIRLWVKKGSRWLQYDHAEGYTIDYASGKVLIPGGTGGANLEFYSYEGIPPRPL